MIASATVQNECRYQRSKRSARLIESFIEAKDPTLSDALASMGKHGLHGGPADGAPCSFGNHQRSRHGPVTSQSQRRHGQHIDGISNKGDCPVFMRLVREVAGNRPKSIADQLTESGNKANDGGACTERTKERPHNAAGSFVGHIREEVDDPDYQAEAEGETRHAPTIGLHQSKSLSRMMNSRGHVVKTRL